VDLVLVLALWLHTVAFVIAWGYYGVLGRFVLPSLSKTLTEADQVKTVVDMERRALPFVLLVVIIFIVTGTYLLVVNVNYAGLGNFSSTWALLMLVKHVVIIGLVAVGLGVDYLIRELPELRDEHRAGQLRNIRLGADAATGLGAIIALLTVVAQLSV
jgi:uncharacterized membrane protein